eukprot:8169343-Lingulodinium_polyedra.AAC.1
MWTGCAATTRSRASWRRRPFGPSCGLGACRPGPAAPSGAWCCERWRRGTSSAATRGRGGRARRRGPSACPS